MEKTIFSTSGAGKTGQLHVKDWNFTLLYPWKILLHCWWECKLVQPLWRTVWRFLEKLKLELWYDPAIPLLGIYPEKNIVWKDTCTPVFIAALFTVAKTWKQPRRSLTDDWIKKMWYTYTMKYYSASKKKEIMPFAATWTDRRLSY